MSNFCKNCGNTIGCSCSGGSQKATGSDGKELCTKCLAKYEQYLALLRINPKNESQKSK